MEIRSRNKREKSGDFINNEISWLSEALALFVVTDSKGGLLGYRLIYKPFNSAFVMNLDVIRGEDAVNKDYKGNGIGKRLRKAAFTWMIKKGFYAYEGMINNENNTSLGNLIEVCEELNLPLERISNNSVYNYFLVILNPDKIPSHNTLPMPHLTYLEKKRAAAMCI